MSTQSLLSLSQDELVKALALRAARSVAAGIKHGARNMVGQRWRIENAIYGMRLGPVPTDIPTLIMACKTRLDGMVNLGRSGHWSYSQSRLYALREAHLALRYLRRREAAAATILEINEAA